MMKKISTTVMTAGLVGTLTCAVVAEEQIPFDSVPPGIGFVSSDQILLDSDVSASGEVASDVGFRFPDGTFQATAAAPAAPAPVAQSLTTNAGLYSNQIADIVPPEPYVEICFKNRDVFMDIHAGSEGTAGGNCLPGDTGWILERLEREAGALTPWTTARAQCLMDGMRLPEPFEWQFGCNNAALLELSEMTDDWEWASNQTQPLLTSGLPSSASTLFGNGGCSMASIGVQGRTDAAVTDVVYRCAR